MKMAPGADLNVTWSLHPDLGSIDETGLYTAPSSVDAPQIVVVTATSVADPTKSGSAEIQLLPPIAVSISPGSATLGPGKTKRFAAAVRNAQYTDVIWAIEPADGGSIDKKGNYTAPASIPSALTVIVTATSEADETKTASATVRLVPSTGDQPAGPH